MTTIRIFDYEAGDDSEIELPAKFEVCSRCDGKGTHVNPAIDGNGLTHEDFDEAGDDFREDYLAGAYDVSCELCKGKRVVAVFDRKRATPEQRRAFDRHQRASAEADADEQSERRYFERAERGFY